MLSTGGISAFAAENPTANTSTQRAASAAEATTELTTQSPEEALNQQKPTLRQNSRKVRKSLQNTKKVKWRPRNTSTHLMKKSAI